MQFCYESWLNDTLQRVSFLLFFVQIRWFYFCAFSFYDLVGHKNLKLSGSIPVFNQDKLEHGLKYSSRLLSGSFFCCIKCVA